MEGWVGINIFINIRINNFEVLTLLWKERIDDMACINLDATLFWVQKQLLNGVIIKNLRLTIYFWKNIWRIINQIGLISHET